MSSYGVGVTITELSPITHIDVKRLSLTPSRDADTEEHDDMIDTDDAVAGVDIKMSPTNPGKATVTYQPNIHSLQQDLRREKHPLQVLWEIISFV